MISNVHVGAYTLLKNITHTVPYMYVLKMGF